MKYIAIILIVISIILVTWLYRCLKKSDAMHANITNKIRHSKIVFYCGMFCIVVTDVVLPIICLQLLEGLVWWVSALAVATFLLMLNPLWIWFLLMYFNWGIYVEDDLIVHYNLFKKKTVYRFADYDILGYQGYLAVVKVYLGRNHKVKFRCCLRIPNSCQNLPLLIEKYHAYSELLAGRYWLSYVQKTAAE